MVALNRAIAVGEVHGPRVALDLVDQLDLPEYHAARADLLRRLGRTEHAATAYDSAANLTPHSAERDYLAGQAAILRQGW